MMLEQLNHLPAWMYQLLWSFLTVAVICLMGQFLTHTVCRRLSAWAAKTA